MITTGQKTSIKHWRSDATLKFGSAPASTALALFVASTCLTWPYCEHRNVDATSVKFSATNGHKVTEGFLLPDTDTLLLRWQSVTSDHRVNPSSSKLGALKNVKFV